MGSNHSVVAQPRQVLTPVVVGTNVNGPVVTHPGAPATATASVAVVPTTFNDGMYTPWTPTQSMIFSPTLASTLPIVLPSTTPSLVIITTSAIPVLTTSLIDPITPSPVPTTPPPALITTSSTFSLLPTPTTSSTDSSSFILSSSSSSDSSSVSATGMSAFDSGSKGASSGVNLSVVVPVIVSLGVLAALIAALYIIARRKKMAKRKWLEARRYDDDETDRSGYATGEKDYQDKQAPWTTFEDQAAYDDSYNQHRPHGPVVASGMQDETVLNAMMADSRRGHEPYTEAPQRQSSLNRAASAIYTSFAGVGTRFTGSAAAQGVGTPPANQGPYNQNGAWQHDGAYPVSPPRAMGPRAQAISDAPERPLLSCVDETPRKQSRHRTTPSASGPPRYALQDVPMQASRSNVDTSLGDTSFDSPSLYSPSAYGYGVSSPGSVFPDSAQPAHSPRSVSRSASPAQGRNPLTQSTASGITYSLGGMAGVLYNGQSSPEHNLTSMPSRKSPRKKPSAVKMRSPLAQHDDGSHSQAYGGYETNARRYQLPQSDSRDSVSALLTDVLKAGNHK